MRTIIILTTAFFMSCQVMTALAEKTKLIWPNITYPVNSNIALIAPEMKLNALPMRIWKLDANMDAAKVVEFYRAQWGLTADSKSIENTISQWRVIGRRIGDYYMAVQVKVINKSQSSGYLSLTHLPAYRERTKEFVFPMMVGSQMLSDQEFTDPGRKSRTLIMTNCYARAVNVNFYSERLLREGWQRDSGFKNTISNNDALFFKRENQEVIMTITTINNGNGSAITASIITTHEKL